MREGIEVIKAVLRRLKIQPAQYIIKLSTGKGK